MNTEFLHLVGDTYVVTGQLAYSKTRFRKGPFSNPNHALGINLWRGSVWQIRNGVKKRVKSVFN